MPHWRKDSDTPIDTSAGRLSTIRRATEPQYVRSGQMVECLRKEWLYSEKRPRDLMFTAIERIVAERPPMMVSQLGREAAMLARHLSAEAGLEFENWDAITRAVMKTLLMAEVLLTPEGRVIHFDITAQAATAGSLREGCRDVAEAFLLEFVIRRLTDVGPRDHKALAHALFRQFDARIPMEDLEDRVVILLAKLAGRVVLSGDVYTFRALSPG